MCRNVKKKYSSFKGFKEQITSNNHLRMDYRAKVRKSKVIDGITYRCQMNHLLIKWRVKTFNPVEEDMKEEDSQFDSMDQLDG